LQLSRLVFRTKKVSKTAALGVGLAFMGLQTFKVFKIEWSNLERLTVEKLDQGGDGKLTFKDVEIGANRVVRNLATDVPSSVGFMSAFWIGFRYG
jgi:uncharacterized membrane protein (Fun14 family)